MSTTDEELTTLQQAQEILRALGFDQERSNDRSALTFLALVHVGPKQSWDKATNDMYGTRALMDFIRDAYGVNYAANSRETIRRFTLHQFSDALLVEQNRDKPDRPVNSPNWNYALHPAALAVVKTYGTARFAGMVETYLEERPHQVETYARAREMARIPVTLLDGAPLTLSPGGQNILIKQMLDELCPRYTPGGEVLYVGDADMKWAHFDHQTLAGLGVTVDLHGKMPDLVVYLREKNWLVLMEAASSHGPVDAKRYGELSHLFKDSTAGLVFISCFPDRKTMRKYLADIAWETEAWCADAPSHLVHFNGERFLGPYK